MPDPVAPQPLGASRRAVCVGRPIGRRQGSRSHRPGSSRTVLHSGADGAAEPREESAECPEAERHAELLDLRRVLRRPGAVQFCRGPGRATRDKRGMLLPGSAHQTETAQFAHRRGLPQLPGEHEKFGAWVTVLPAVRLRHRIPGAPVGANLGAPSPSTRAAAPNLPRLFSVLPTTAMLTCGAIRTKVTAVVVGVGVVLPGPNAARAPSAGRRRCWRSASGDSRRAPCAWGGRISRSRAWAFRTPWRGFVCAGALASSA